MDYNTVQVYPSFISETWYYNKSSIHVDVLE